MRARMALLSADIKTELREVDLRNKPSQMLQVSPKATVPVLVLTDGSILEESLDIMKWSLAISDPNDWLLNLNKQQLNFTNKIIDENDSEFKKNLDQYKYADRFPELNKQETRFKGEAFLVKLDSRLQQSNYLNGSQLSFLDVAVFPFVRQFAYVDKEWFDASKYTYLQKWLQTLLDSDLFNVVMKKVPAWENGTAEVFLEN